MATKKASKPVSDNEGAEAVQMKAMKKSLAKAKKGKKK